MQEYIRVQIHKVNNKFLCKQQTSPCKNSPSGGAIYWQNNETCGTETCKDQNVNRTPKTNLILDQYITN